MRNVNVRFKSTMDEIKGLAMCELFGATTKPGKDFWIIEGVNDDCWGVLWDLCSYFKAW